MSDWIKHEGAEPPDLEPWVLVEAFQEGEYTDREVISAPMQGVARVGRIPRHKINEYRILGCEDSIYPLTEFVDNFDGSVTGKRRGAQDRMKPIYDALEIDPDSWVGVVSHPSGDMRAVRMPVTQCDVDSFRLVPAHAWTRKEGKR